MSMCWFNYIQHLCNIIITVNSIYALHYTKHMCLWLITTSYFIITMCFVKYIMCCCEMHKFISFKIKFKFNILLGKRINNTSIKYKVHCITDNNNYCNLHYVALWTKCFQQSHLQHTFTSSNIYHSGGSPVISPYMSVSKENKSSLQ